MSLIKKQNELEIPATIKMMIYGQAGMFKTSTALSAPRPLLLDFDGGVKRVNMSFLDGVGIVQIKEWQDVKSLMNENLADYDTIVVDTVGKMLDYIISYKCGSRQPQIRDWGGINQEFTWFTRCLSGLNKNIVFVAHRDTRKDGDETVFIPAMREKSYNQIVTELDLLGYMEAKNINGKMRCTITFDPTSRNDGKNTCSLPGVMEVPNIVDANGNVTGKNDFISARVIAPYKEMLAVKEQARKAYGDLVKLIKSDISAITDAASANEVLKGMKRYKHVGSSLQVARTLFTEKVKELGLTYDKEKKEYTDESAES